MRAIRKKLTTCGLPRPRAGRRRSAFTLIEMLVVVGIIAIIATISIGALMVMPERARAGGTRALIAKIDARLLQLVAEFNRGKSNVTPDPMDALLSVANPSRAKVIAQKSKLRQEFPELFSDLDLRLGLAADSNRDGYLSQSEFQTAVYWGNTTCPKPPLYRNSLPPPNCSTPPAPAAILLTGSARTYWQQIAEKLANCPPPGHQRGRTERAELLFLIVTRGGTETSDFSAGEIADTDGDGLDEFVDKWGNPIQFFLWPSYYSSPRQEPGAESDSDDPNQLLVQADWWNPPAVTDPRPRFEELYHSLRIGDASGSPKAKGYRTFPLIVSAGSDGGFGLEGVPGSLIGWTAANENPAGPDQIIGTQDDLLPIGLTASAPGNALPLVSAALRIVNKATDGYAQDLDNIDNHSLRAR